jgi:hypothetical protein
VNNAVHQKNIINSEHVYSLVQIEYKIIIIMPVSLAVCQAGPGVLKTPLHQAFISLSYSDSSWNARENSSIWRA